MLPQPHPLADFIARALPPEPWAEGDNIPWDEPGFSERMLAEHLSQEHDLASRRQEAVTQGVEWLYTTILDAHPGRILDLACGPGLYTTALAHKGCTCTGIDFSPASIRHAQDTAEAVALPCTYRQADLREGGYGLGFDVAILIYGQFNVFPRDRGSRILDEAYRSLVPGGRLVLEIQSPTTVEENGLTPPSWYTVETGLFSPAPHLVLQENFWCAEKRASINRFAVQSSTDGLIRTYSITNEAYTEDEVAQALRSAGFEGVEWHPSLTGTAQPEGPDMPVVVAHKPA